MKLILAKLTVLLMVVFSSSVYAADRDIFLSRHAEKAVDGTRNPPLTDIGHKRARYIAQLLKSKNVIAIYSTDYLRTQDTAAPLAKLLGLKVLSYDAKKLKEFAEQVKQTKGNILIVGHSNTTPDLAMFLGGDSKGEMDESQYDRMYQLSVSGSKVITTIINSKPK